MPKAKRNQLAKDSRRAGGRRKHMRKQMHENQHLQCPYITREIPFFEIASEIQLEKIEAAAERILAEIGIEIHGDSESVSLFTKAGARARPVGAGNTRLTFEPGMLRSILKSAPPHFTQRARNPANDVKIGGNSLVFAPSYGSPFIIDMEKGRRYGTLDDFENLVKLSQSSPWLHHSGGTICEPTDIPVNKRHLDMIFAHMKYSDRPFLGSVTAAERAADSIEMCRILFGKDVVANNCVIMGNVNANSPLVFDVTVTRVIREYAAAGQGVVVTPFIMGGAMAPITTAAGIAQTLAETMTGCALSQLVRPGAPVVFGSFLSSMSLRSGSPTFGTPEPAAGSLIIGQLARRLDLPLRCAGNFSTAKTADAQSMVQSTMSMLSAVQCGANFLLHSAGFLDGLLSMSYEKFMMDLDLCGALHSYLAGIKINDETLAMDAFHEVGPAHHFLGCAHTMAHYNHAYWGSALNDDTPYETWEENGKIDSITRANQAWKKTLADYEAPHMETDREEALRDFVARKKSAQPDTWY